MSSRRSRIDFSLEVGHVGLADLDDGVIEALSGVTERWALPIHRRLEQEGSVDTVLLLDDYFFGGSHDELEIAKGRITKAIEDAGLPVDSVVRESEMVPLAELINRFLVRAPRQGDGTREKAIAGANERWLVGTGPESLAASHSGERVNIGANPFSDRGDERSEKTPLPPTPSVGRGSSYGSHAITIDVELYSGNEGADQRLWSCALLAAAWQLYRLGLPVPGAEEMLLPAARENISVLDGTYLEVEAAVQRIIKHLYLPADQLSFLRIAEDNPSNEELLARISYAFAAVDRFIGQRASGD